MEKSQTKSSMQNKEFFINAVKMIEVDGNNCIPSILYYKKDKSVVIGQQAISEAHNRYEINEDFKIDLGEIDPKASIDQKRKFKTARGENKSAAQLTNDFLYELIKFANQWLEYNEVIGETNIMLAEPLAMQTDIVSSDWLSKYRDNLKRILIGKMLGGNRIGSVDFLPEPFAVFQYYRHGYRHPFLSGKTKYNVLVIDFGGGTFDVCIIETTSKGDISQTGRNSRPLAASSDPFGGYFVNKLVAKSLIQKYSSSTLNTKIKKGIALYDEWRRGKVELSTLANEYQNFINIFYETIYNVEIPKLAICNLITDWRLDATLSQTAPVILPENPFSGSNNTINVQFSANEFRSIFINELWEKLLKQIIQRAIKRGKAELLGAPIQVVLLSGGSANIGWLRELVRRDFSDELGFAEILRLPDFQEVVAKGLAVECARRYYNEGEGDFSSVTYNRLCLILDPDSKGYNLKVYKPITEGLPRTENQPGVLLASASPLKKFLEKPMSWKVRLDRPPRNNLDYYFLRSSLDPKDLDNLQNIEERNIFTPSYCKTFDANFKLELFVKQDGTATPKFIYKTGRFQEKPMVKNGKPFFLDMTYSQTPIGSKAYFGIDFGTSYTSISYVDENSVDFYLKRAEERSWRDLNELQSILPYPLSAPLAHYLSESNPSKLVYKAFDFIEAALAMAAYISYFDFCINKGKSSSKTLKGFTQRSAGPLWGLLKECINKTKKLNSVSSHYVDLMNPDFYEFIEKSLKIFGFYKHNTESGDTIDHLRIVQIFANISQIVFSDWQFGFFEGVEKQKFGSEYEGIFRHASGQAPFIQRSTYRGSIPFSKDQAILVNLTNNIAISLQPLIFWDSCPKHPDLFVDHCYIYDKAINNKKFSFKAVGFPCSCEVSVTNQYRGLADEIIKIREADPKYGFLDNINLIQVSEN